MTNEINHNCRDKRGINVLSLFDGISCGQVALERAGIEVDNYYASEIDEYAIKVTQKNYPKTIQLGDVKKVNSENLPKIDLLIGGSPCQGFSLAGKQLNFNDERSKLFFEFVRILNEVKPKYFLLENVKMKKEFQEIISNILGIEPIEIDSSLVSAQNRRRLYWTNIPLMLPEDKEILIQQILEYGINKNESINENIFTRASVQKHAEIGINKSTTLTASMGMGGGYVPLIMNEERLQELKGQYIDGEQRYIKMRKLTILECERLQNLPDDYTNGISNTQRYKCIGNGWTVDVIAHLFKGILEPSSTSQTSPNGDFSNEKEHNISLKDNPSQLSQMSKDTSLNNNIKQNLKRGLTR